MTMSGRLTTRTRTLLRQRFCSLAPICSLRRPITSVSSTRSLLVKTKPQQSSFQLYQLRLFSSSATSEEQHIGAPNAKAYLASGVVKRAENKVDVKKVLVIGSGGLSIGQAGEFDYSGK